MLSEVGRKWGRYHLPGEGSKGKAKEKTQEEARPKGQVACEGCSGDRRAEMSQQLVLGDLNFCFQSIISWLGGHNHP